MKFSIRKTSVMLPIVALIILIGAVVAWSLFYGSSRYTSGYQSSPSADYKNTEYLIDGAEIKLVDGMAENVDAPGSAAKTITRYFGNELHTDLDGDGHDDVVFLLTQSKGGTGTFYYVVAALNTAHGYIGSQALYLGDRISPQTTEKGKGRIVIVNYADRAPGEPFVTSPSVGKSIWLLLDPATMQFGEVAQNFEGESR